MPYILPKKPAPTSFDAMILKAAGDASDFTAFAIASGLDELERETNPEHDAFTFVFRYRGSERDLLATYPGRLDGLWRRGDGTWLAAGDTRGLVHIRPTGVEEIGVADSRGIFSAIWGTGDHVFAVGGFPAFAYYWQGDRVSSLSLPDGTDDIRDVCGFSHDDVYFVGAHGQVHHFDGTRVTRLRVPVSHGLNCIVRFGADRMCIGGYHGALLVGRGSRWRYIVTETADPLHGIGVLGDRVYYGAEHKLWSSDARTPPVPEFPFHTHLVNGLVDAVVVSNHLEAKLYANGAMHSLDTKVHRDAATTVP
jgi:hypothetical protein